MGLRNPFCHFRILVFRPPIWDIEIFQEVFVMKVIKEMSEFLENAYHKKLDGMLM